jgi:hypothetical protein
LSCRAATWQDESCPTSLVFVIAKFALMIAFVAMAMMN